MKLVDIATYVTGEHNMDSMKSSHAMMGDAMKGDAMNGDAMHDDAMKGDAVEGDAMHGDAMKGDAMKSDAMNGDAMKGDAMTGGAMHGDAMKGGAMHGDAMKGDRAMGAGSCPALGLATRAGKVFLVSTQEGSPAAKALCAKVGTTVSLAGSICANGGMNVFVVSSIM